MRRLDEHPFYGFAMALLTALMWGILPVVFTLLRGGPDVKAVTWIRFAFSAVVVWLFLWRRGKLPVLGAWQARDWAMLGFAVFFLAGNFILYLLGLELISPEATVVIIQLAPFILMFGSVFIYGERFTPVEWLGAAVLFIGLILFFNDRLALLMQAFTSETLGILYILFAAIAWGIYGLLQKSLLRKTGSIQLTLLMYGGGALMLLPVSAASSLLDMNALQGAAVLFGCLNMVVGYGAFTEALRVWQGAKVSAVIALAPIITIGGMQLAVLLWPTHFVSSGLNLWAYAGAALVVCGSMLAALGKQRGSR
ncbi:MAG: DMT family transporter [Pseudomonadota bacterium]|nr:DMT family transporter [Pseudomonadota bacterium]